MLGAFFGALRSAFPYAAGARAREPGAAPAGRGADQGPWRQAPPPGRVGPNVLGGPLRRVGGLERLACDRGAGHGSSVASPGLPKVLVATEPGQEARTSGPGSRGRGSDPEEGSGQGELGRPAHPQRVRQARIEVAVSTVTRYMPVRPGPPSPTWRAFLDASCARSTPARSNAARAVTAKRGGAHGFQDARAAPSAHRLKRPASPPKTNVFSLRSFVSA